MDAIIDENKKSWLQRFILWREKKIKEKHFILILSFLAGIFTALAAWFLKFLVEWIKEFLTENFDSTGVNWLYLVYPVFGIFLTGLFIRYIVKDDKNQQQREKTRWPIHDRNTEKTHTKRN